MRPLTTIVLSFRVLFHTICVFYVDVSNSFGALHMHCAVHRRANRWHWHATLSENAGIRSDVKISMRDSRMRLIVLEPTLTV